MNLTLIFFYHRYEAYFIKVFYKFKKSRANIHKLIQHQYYYELFLECCLVRELFHRKTEYLHKRTQRQTTANKHFLAAAIGTFADTKL